MTQDKHSYIYMRVPKSVRLTALALMLIPASASAQVEGTSTDSTTTAESNQNLGEATVSARRKPLSRLNGVENGFTMNRQEIFKAACCNLGESFTTNPSVDVNYTDAATGARQVKLLGLAGSYVQMLTENVPAFRGAASPYALGYVPGPWMQSIQVSKGSASVKNGYESITGQINVEYKKPQTTPSMEVNLYGDSRSRAEANFDGNVHLNEKLSTGILGHYEDNFGHHDGNHDGFLDMTKVRQYHLQNRWAWMGKRYFMQAAVNALGEKRTGGQTDHAHLPEGQERYGIGTETHRYDGFLKNAFVLNEEHATNLALILSGSNHQADASYGHREYDVLQREGYASLMLEMKFTEMHSLSAGLSVNHDYYKQHYRLSHDLQEPLTLKREKETTPGAYAQYTFNLDDRLTLMGGIRVDHSSVYGTFVTPRFHLKYAPNHHMSFRLSAGNGHRSVHALADYNYLLASGREFKADPLEQESAWNYGASANFKIPLLGHILDLSADYYYTRFNHQVLVDMDEDIHTFHIKNLDGKSFSHTVQVEANYPLFRGMSLTAAYRYNMAKQTTGGVLQERPLSSKWKTLVTATYKTPLELWQFDATVTINGSGRLPLHFTDGTFTTTSSTDRFPTFAQLNAQITRWFRHCSVYVGGENLTNYKQKNPIIGAHNPWSTTFDATQVWGPIDGAMVYAGVRFNLEKSK